jgi:hypothetical protein
LENNRFKNEDFCSRKATKVTIKFIRFGTTERVLTATMKLSILVLVLGSAYSFSILPLRSIKTANTALHYTIIGAPDEEEQEKNKQPPVQQAKTATDSQFGPGSLDGYLDYDESAELDEELNIDAYDSMAGGIRPGFQLSSLCSDD